MASKQKYEVEVIFVASERHVRITRVCDGLSTQYDGDIAEGTALNKAILFFVRRDAAKAASSDKKAI